MDGEGRKRRKRKRTVRAKLYNTKKGRILKIRNKTYRIAKNVKMPQIRRLLQDQAVEIYPQLKESIEQEQREKILKEKEAEDIKVLKNIETQVVANKDPALFQKLQRINRPELLKLANALALTVGKPAGLSSYRVGELRDFLLKNNVRLDEGHNDKSSDGKDEIDEDIRPLSIPKKKPKSSPEPPPSKEDLEEIFRRESQLLNELERDIDFGESLGKGKGRWKGLSNLQIDRMMKKYPEYLGTISHDEFLSRILPHVGEKTRGCCIINTDPRNKPGQHWQALYWDGRPNGDHEIDFFDSYGDKIKSNDRLLRDIKSLASKLSSDSYLKLKENRIRYQSDSSDECGFFCMKFCIDRLHGRPFRDASGFSQIVKGEAQIAKFKHQLGFGYIESFSPTVHRQRGEAAFYTYYPPGVRKYLIDEPITSLKIGRQPISGGINKALNILTVGGWERAKKDVGFADAFHLYLIINGKYRLERNHVIEMYPYKPNSNEEILSLDPVAKHVTIREFLERTAAKVGPELQRYNAASNNCQIAVIQFLQSNGLLTPEASKFIKQDIEKVVSKLPWYSEWVAKKITDTAHIGDKLVHGTNRKR